MENLQADNIEIAQKNKIILYFHALNFILLILNFSFNFLGNPALKYVYVAQVVTIATSIIFFKFEYVLMEIITLLFIEGQGRVVWEYQSWSRIIFDLLIFYSIAKIFISNKKLMDRKLLTMPIYICILLHFIWYIIQIFNIYSISMFGVIAASKIYIFPILLFLGVLQSNLDVKKEYFKTVYYFFVFILILEIALTLFQVQMKESLMLQLSPYYIKPMKEGIFTGTLYRPFGTTALPGTISIYLFTTVGFLFLFQFRLLGTLFKYGLIASSIMIIIFCQVRSALVKYLLIVGLIQLGLMIYERLKPKAVIPVFIIFITLIISGKTILLSNDKSGDENIDYAKKRMSSLTEIDAVKKDRINIDTFIKVAYSKLSTYPLGLGPGVTGAAASLIKDDIIQNPHVKLDYLWHFDSLFISLFIDLGVGAIFYLALIFYITVYLFKNLFYFYKIKDLSSFNIVLICFSTIFVIIIGNWGAIGLTYNPESFVFWFLAAIGIKTINKEKGKIAANA